MAIITIAIPGSAPGTWTAMPRREWNATGDRGDYALTPSPTGHATPVPLSGQYRTDPLTFLDGSV